MLRERAAIQTVAQSELPVVVTAPALDSAIGEKRAGVPVTGRDRNRRKIVPEIDKAPRACLAVIISSPALDLTDIVDRAAMVAFGGELRRNRRAGSQFGEMDRALRPVVIADREGVVRKSGASWPELNRQLA